MPHFELPAHIEFTQSMTCPIEGSLSESTAQSLTIGQLLQLSGEKFDSFNELELSYAPLKGGLKLRKAIAKFHERLNHHRTPLNENNVLTFCGAQETLSSIYQCLLVPKDEVIVVTPNYPSLITMAENRGCVVKAIELSAQNKWQLTIKDFENKLTDKTKLIVLNSPHNPTGTVIDSDLAEQILSLAKQHSCYILADDVSQASNYHELALSHRLLDYDKAVVVSVMSKSFGLAGLRIGWAISKNEDLLLQLLAIKSDSSICCSAIDEAVAELAFKQSGRIIKPNNHLIKANIALFQKFVNEHQNLFHWQPPQAGMLAIVEVKNVTSIELWAKDLAKNTGILILPATLFGLSGSYFRLGLGKNNFKYLLTQLSAFLKQ